MNHTTTWKSENWKRRIIDTDKPFAIVLPMNAGNIAFYDIDGNIVEYTNNPL